jgi:hypothetical protein
MFLSRPVIFSVPGQIEGTLPIFSGSAWAGLQPGIAGQYLKTRGPGSTPIWDWVEAPAPTPTARLRFANEDSMVTDVTFTMPDFVIPVGLKTIEMNVSLQAAGADQQMVNVRVLLNPENATYEHITFNKDGTDLFDEEALFFSLNEDGESLDVSMAFKSGVFYRISILEA